jgi:hypothetical protein
LPDHPHGHGIAQRSVGPRGLQLQLVNAEFRNQTVICPTKTWGKLPRNQYLPRYLPLRRGEGAACCMTYGMYGTPFQPQNGENGPRAGA